MGAQIWPKKEEFANVHNVAMKDVQIKLKREECALNMVHMSSDAALKDVQIKLSKEEYAKGMGQMSNDAALKDVQIKLSID